MRVFPHRADLAFHHLVSRAVAAVGGIHLVPVAEPVEVDVFEESGDHHAVVAVGHGVVDELSPIPLGRSESGAIDIRRFGGDHLLQRAGRVLIVLLQPVCRGVRLHSHRAGVDEAVGEPWRHRSVGVDLGPVVTGPDEVSDPEERVRGADRRPGPDGHPPGVCFDDVPLGSGLRERRIEVGHGHDGTVATSRPRRGPSDPCPEHPTRPDRTMSQPNEGPGRPAG
ncbi:hypothetical protein GCM10028781_02700 [Nostocoides australiense]